MSDIYPDRAGVARVWDRAAPVTSDPDVVAFLRSRRLDPDLIALTSTARVLPAQCPDWVDDWWYPQGYRLIIPIWDSDLSMRSFKARNVLGRGKERTPTGYSIKGLAMLDQVARMRMARHDRCDLVIVEGGPDYLTWCERLAETEDPIGVMGVFSGSWRAEHGWADRINDGARVYIRTDQDASGDKYAAAIGRTIQGKACLYRIARDGDGDDNDEWKARRLPRNPEHGCKPWTPPPPEEHERSPGKMAAPDPERDRAYALAALAGCCEAVRGAQKSDANNELNRQAFKAGRLCTGHGAPLSRMRVEEDLGGAAHARGVPRAEAVKTINSALSKAPQWEGRTESEDWRRPRLEIVQDDAPPPSSGAFGSDAPVDARARIPEPYYLEGKPPHVAIMKKINDPKKEDLVVSDRAILIAGVVEGVGADITHWVRVIWRNDLGRWDGILCERRTIADRARIIDLSQYGAPVDTTNANMVVGWLTKWNNANSSVLSRTQSSGQMGWADARHGRSFLAGESTITASGARTVRAHEPSTWASDALAFRPSDDGERQRADGYHVRGDAQAWHAMARRAIEHDPVAVVMAAAFASPMLSLLGTSEGRCIFVELASRTTGGKTTAQTLCASVYGRPRDTVQTWNSTTYALTKLASTLRHLPLILNDTKSASKISDWGSITYQLCEGQARAQGSVKGLRETPRWHCSIISSGEHKMSALVKGGDGGAHVRVLSITVPPLGGYEQRELAAEISRTANLHYGHAGRSWLQHLAGLDEEALEALRERVEETERRLVAMAPDGDGHRLAADLAVLDVAGEEAWKVIGLGEWTGAVERLAPLIYRETSGSDVARVALDYVLGHCASHIAALPSSPGVAERAPASGWLGSWRDHGEGDLCIIRTRLVEILRGIDVAPDVIHEWHSRGWLSVSHGARRPDRKVQITRGNRPRCIVIRADAIRSMMPDDLMDGADDDTDGLF